MARKRNLGAIPLSPEAYLTQIRQQYLHGVNADDGQRYVNKPIDSGGFGALSDFPVTSFVVIGIAALFVFLANRD